MEKKVYDKLEDTILNLNVETISTDRKKVLQPIIDFVQSKVTANKDANINFICTHNSRRSHLTQIWAQTLANYFNFKNVTTYSGGTESTAMFPMVAETLKNTGFEILELSESKNPVYAIKFNDNTNPIIGFSKKYDAKFNPASGFAAIMTCSQADGGCPFIAGAEKRIPITYDDPKMFDNTPQQAEKYQERSLQIATEMFYIFSNIKK